MTTRWADNPHEAAILEPGGEVTAAAENSARFVLIAGEPHGEPIRLRGSFVD